MIVRIVVVTLYIVYQIALSYNILCIVIIFDFIQLSLYAIWDVVSVVFSCIKRVAYNILWYIAIVMVQSVRGSGK